ncbi:MAG: MASE3 domain-containing protein, partial [Candidatus Nanoarchaeia archaeon]|nr:MASE3 domain-containing protein [Candidatus Nanoarchaeia archaeon]
CYVEGVGLTGFKIISEYIICGIIIVATYLLYTKRKEFDPKVFKLLLAFNILLITSELSFTQYISVYGFMNALGHIFKFFSVIILARALINSTLKNPFNTLFKKLNETLQESELKSEIIDTAKDKILTTDTKGNIEYANKSILIKIGYSFDEIIKHNILEIIKPENEPAFKENMYNATIKGDAGFESMIKTKTGDEIPVDVLLQKTKNKKEEKFLIIMRNIADRKKIEQLKNDLNILTTYNIKQPLMAILGYTDLILQKSKKYEFKDYIIKIKSNAKELKEMVNQMHEIFKMNPKEIKEFEKKELTYLVKNSIPDKDILLKRNKKAK